ncbi:MAG TPA: substrate-binding domain-containing protein, partial [Spirochaetia bacterium]|nr:substrate-binding domain-containing protein [Spirochaetia bacterium]
KVVHEAMQSGIKVITFDAPAPSTEALTYIGTDNEQAGYDAGLHMAKAMGYHGKLAILQGGLAATNLNQRSDGFKRALRKVAPAIQVVALVDEHGDFAESIIKTEELLRQFPDLRGIFSVSAEGAPSAATVARQQHRQGQLVIAGFDDLQDTLDGIASGLISFCVVQNTYKMGWLSVEELLAAVHGRPIPKVIDTGVVFVYKSNLSSYTAQLAGGSVN